MSAIVHRQPQRRAREWEIVFVNPRPLPVLFCAWYRGMLMRPVPVMRKRAPDGNP